jgi:hypothetical protein
VPLVALWNRCSRRVREERSVLPTNHCQLTCSQMRLSLDGAFAHGWSVRMWSIAGPKRPRFIQGVADTQSRQSLRETARVVSKSQLPIHPDPP